MTSQIPWNAEVYDRIGTPMRRWAQAVIAETVRRYGEPFTADYVRLDLWARKP